MLYSLFTYRVLLSLVLVFASTNMSRAQAPRLNSLGDGTVFKPVQNITGDEADYFEAGFEKGVKQALANVERYHMGRSVVEAIAKGHYKEALPDINFVLRYFPNHPMGLQFLTSLAVLSNNRALPIEYFEKAIALYPKHAITHAQYGWYYVTIDRLDRGIRKLREAIEMEPELTAAYIWLSEAYNKKGESKLSRAAADRARELGYDGVLPGELKK